MRMGAITVVLSGALLGGAPSRAAVAQESDTTRDAAPAAPGAHAPGVFENAEALLRALERADSGIRTLSAVVSYDRFLKLEGDRRTRYGRLYFRQEAPDAGARKDRAFGVHFDTLFVDDRKQDDPQVYVFDGRWLVEVRPKERRITRREVARAGEAFDPLKVGEGPMPLPIGQKADDILAKYIAELLPPEDALTDEQRDGLPTLSNWVQVKLTPRPLALAPGQKPDRDEFREIRLWYERDSLLPRMARTVSRGLDESFVVLTKLTLNEPLPEGAIAIADPPASEGWQVQVEPLPPSPGKNASEGAGR